VIDTKIIKDYTNDNGFYFFLNCEFCESCTTKNKLLDCALTHCCVLFSFLRRVLKGL